VREEKTQGSRVCEEDRAHGNFDLSLWEYGRGRRVGLGCFLASGRERSQPGMGGGREPGVRFEQVRLE
jgi:hypothetical protein